MASLVQLTENNIPGASLGGRVPSKLKMNELLDFGCRGDSCRGRTTKAQFVKK